MNVRFLRDFQGVATQERFFLAGEVVELDDGTAQAVIAEGAAEPLVVEAPTAQVEPEPKAKAKK